MNFNPKFLNSKLLLSQNKNNKIFCRNFIFTILVFDLFNTEKLTNNKTKFKNQFMPINYKFFIFKKRTHIGSFLRAPYKCKSAQFSLGLNRYFLLLSFYIKSDYNLNINNLKDFNKILNFIKSYNYFESILVTQVSRLFSIPLQIKIL